MTIRTTVTVALALAILAASLPAIETARVQHSDNRVAGAVDRLERAARALSAQNDVVGGQAARRYVTLRLPRRSWATSGLARLSIPASLDGPDVRWAVAGGRNRTHRLAVPLLAAGDGLALASGGRTRVALTLHRRQGERVVLVARPGETGVGGV